MYETGLEGDALKEGFRQMQLIITIATQLVLEEKSSDEFLEWAQLAIPSIAPSMFEDYPPEEHEKIAYWMGVNLWNAAPQPNHHFKPTPLPNPARNNPCPCGSGLKYKQCCARLPALEPLPTQVFYAAMPEIMSKSHINRLIKNHELPVDVISIMVDHFLDDDDYAQVIKMLEPLFEGNARRLNHKHSGLLDMLCDSYNIHYKTDKKKKDLLQRMCHHNDKVIRAEAWQRIASWQLDQGNNQAAMNALTEAMRADPNNPSHSLLELTLLLSSNQTEQAKQRAGFWLHKLKHYQNDYPDLINTLQLAKSDPQAALQSINNRDDDNRLQQLLEWIDSNSDKPVAHYSVSEMADMRDTDVEDTLRNHLSSLGINSKDINNQLSKLKQDINSLVKNTDETSNPNQANDDPMQNAICLIPPLDIADLDLNWFEVTPLEKPFSVQYETVNGAEVWHDNFETDWLEFLQENPDAINSLDILDDITTLIVMHPQNETPWGPIRNIQPLLERAKNIIQQANVPDNKTLPWVMPENRPALRLLSHYINLVTENDDPQKMMQLMQLYLRLNPHDNHGYRGELINHYLQQNMNLQAQTLAKAYPDDMLAEISYGHVLALYKQGKHKDAEQALKAANKTLPLVAKYLIKTSVTQPKFSPHGISYGGKDQAWIYRKEMRDTWLQATGSIDWLKKVNPGSS